MKVLSISKLRLILDKIESENQTKIYDRDMKNIYEAFGDTAYYSREDGGMVVVEKGKNINDINSIELNY